MMNYGTDIHEIAKTLTDFQGDFKAREILEEIAGMAVNDTTNQLTTRIIFGDDYNNCEHTK